MNSFFFHIGIPFFITERIRKMNQLKNCLENRGLEIPLIQGGMGVGVSPFRLSGGCGKNRCYGLHQHRGLRLP